MIQVIRTGWRRLPAPLRNFIRNTGIFYAADYLATYREMHRRERFAGNLVELHELWQGDRNGAAGPAVETSLSNIFEAIVLPNGVRKTTEAGRQKNTLDHFLSRPERPPEGSSIRVLDLPCSSGIASISLHDQLRSHYAIKSYVLSDLCLELQYDAERNAVYDSQGNLLQVKGPKRFFNLHRAHASGPTSTFIANLLLWPFTFRARQLKRKYALDRGGPYRTLRLLHPEAERRVSQGIFSVRSADVFSLAWDSEFDLALSFNLLQKNYFPDSRIAEGRANLCKALVEGGYLVLGNTESFGVFRKVNGALVPQYQQGDW